MLFDDRFIHSGVGTQINHMIFYQTRQRSSTVLLWPTLRRNFKIESICHVMWKRFLIKRPTVERSQSILSNISFPASRNLNDISKRNIRKSFLCKKRYNAVKDTETCKFDNYIEQRALSIWSIMHSIRAQAHVTRKNATKYIFCYTTDTKALWHVATALARCHLSTKVDTQHTYQG